MSILVRVFTGSFWAATGGVVNRGCGLLSMILVARLLGGEAFGEFGLIRNTLLMLLTFGSVGVGVAATKFVAQYRGSPDCLTKAISWFFQFSLLLGLAMALTLIILSGFISGTILEVKSANSGLQLAALAVFFCAINNCQTGILSGFEAFKFVALINVGNGLFTLVAVAVGARLWGVDGAVLGLGLAALLSSILGKQLLARLRKGVANNDAATRTDQSAEARFNRNEINKYCLAITLSGILVAPVLWLCNAFLSRSDDGLMQVALYEAANQWRMLILFVPSLMAQVLLPVFASVNNRGEFNSVLKISILITFSASAFMALLLALLPSQLMSLYGSQFIGAVEVVRWLAATAVLMAVNNTIGQAIAGSGNVWHGFVMNLIWAALVLVLSWCFVSKQMGAAGVAAAQFIAYAIHTVLQMVYTKYFMLKDKSALRLM